MLELKICRICLEKDVKMYKYDRYQLKCYYEQIMAIKVIDKDGLPLWFCFECATMLHKFHKFKEKCYRGQKALNEILCIGPITFESVDKIDRYSKNLQSPLDIINVNNRVKTYLARHKPPTNKYARQMIQVVEPIIESPLSEVYHEETIVDTVTIIDDPIDDKKAEVDDIMVDDVKIEMSNEFDDVLEVDEIVLTIENKIDINDTNTLVDDKISSDNEKNILKVTTKSDKKLKRQNNAKRKINIKEKKNDDYEEILKIKKFQHIKPKKFFDNANWQKFNLTEEEALREFKARSKCPTYLKSDYQCNDCIKGFSKKEILARHLKLKHNESGRPLECRFCRIRFKLNCHMSKHLRQHYVIYKCMRCEMRFSLENSATFHDEYHNGVIKTCKHCGKEFRHSSTYYTHLRTHRSAHVCALCGESFVSETGLLQHKRIKHVIITEDESAKDEETNTYCERCDIKFVTLKAYKEHLYQSAFHTEINEGAVDAKPVKAKPVLKKNRNYSTKRRKPTTCHYCGKEFSTQSACMKHHLAEHRGSCFTPERHICEICGASLAYMSLESHMNTHTREKVYPCATCSMQFYSKSSLNRHQLTHTGEKPYKCISCDKRFTQKNSMMLHYRTFHLKQPYPKRNRKKKTDELPIGEAYQNEESADNAPLKKWR